MHQETIRGIDIPISQKYMLSIREASAYFNIGVKKMRRVAEDNEGEFALFMGNRYLICRPKFEEYLLGIMKNPEKTCDLFRRVNRCFFVTSNKHFCLWNRNTGYFLKVLLKPI